MALKSKKNEPNSQNPRDGTKDSATKKSLKIDFTALEKRLADEASKKEGFFVQVTGPDVHPASKQFLTGSHGTGEGRLLRGAKWALREIARTEVGRGPEHPLEFLYERGFRKMEVFHLSPEKGVKKTNIGAKLKDLLPRGSK